MEYIQGKLSDLLFAYRKGCSTQHVLMHAIKEWKTALDRGQHVGVVMMDLVRHLMPYHTAFFLLSYTHMVCHKMLVKWLEAIWQIVNKESRLMIKEVAGNTLFFCLLFLKKKMFIVHNDLVSRITIWWLTTYQTAI